MDVVSIRCCASCPPRRLGLFVEAREGGGVTEMSTMMCLVVPGWSQGSADLFSVAIEKCVVLGGT